VKNESGRDNEATVEVENAADENRKEKAAEECGDDDFGEEKINDEGE